MKIIGTTKQDTYILEIHGSDISKLIGEPVETGYSHGRQLYVGCELKLSEAWSDLKRFRDAAASIDAATQTLRAVALLAEATRSNYVVEPSIEEGAENER